MINIGGDLSQEITNFDSSFFCYLKNDKSTRPYVTYEYEFVIDKKNLIKNKTVRYEWVNKV